MREVKGGTAVLIPSLVMFLQAPKSRWMRLVREVNEATPLSDNSWLKAKLRLVREERFATFLIPLSVTALSIS